MIGDNIFIYIWKLIIFDNKIEKIEDIDIKMCYIIFLINNII